MTTHHQQQTASGNHRATQTPRQVGALVTAPIFTLTAITGELRTNTHQITTAADITVDHHGRATLVSAPINLTAEKNAWLFYLVPRGGRLATWSSFHGAEPNGVTITTDHLTIEGDGPTSDPHGPTTVTLRGTITRGTITHRALPATNDGCRVVYRTIGLRGFRAQHTTTSAGPLTLAGATNIEDYDAINGFLKITPSRTQALNDWLEQTDETARHTLKIISLAEGKLLHWSIRQTYDEHQLLQTQLNGAHHTDPPMDGIWDFLDLQPVLDLSIKYNDHLRATTGIELAIELFLMHPTYLEVQLLTAMTALEHLVSKYAKHHTIPPPIEKKIFATVIKPALETAYDQVTTTMTRPGIERVRSGISELNRLYFKEQLQGMLAAYNIPLAGITDRIKPVIDVRNEIVHEGHYLGEFKDLHLHVVVLRELLKRIFLTLLEFQGRYECWLNGQELITFPPTNITIQP
jgi:hypothetical protein